MFQRRILAPLAVSAALLAALTACSSGGGDKAESAGENGPEGLIDPGTLNLCVSLSYEPLEYYENGTSGEVVGWDADGARALGELWGVDTKVNVMDFDGMIPGLQSGRCDLVWSGMYVSEERLQVTDAVPVLRTGSEVLLTEAAAKDVEERLDLCGLRIAAQTGSEDSKHIEEVSTECEAAGKPAIEVTGYPGSVDAIASINSGKLDGLIDTTTLVATLAQKNESLEPVPGLFESDYWFGAFTEKGSEISDDVEDGIHTLIENGTLAELAEKYGLNPDDVAAVDSVAP